MCLRMLRIRSAGVFVYVSGAFDPSGTEKCVRLRHGLSFYCDNGRLLKAMDEMKKKDKEKRRSPSRRKEIRASGPSPSIKQTATGLRAHRYSGAILPLQPRVGVSVYHCLLFPVATLRAPRGLSLPFPSSRSRLGLSGRTGDAVSFFLSSVSVYRGHVSKQAGM